ncbi:CBS domain-containing protein [Denitromonas ohlonensis]|uniref:CBS domain-containing protein n=2 Tax=Denitromonas TaxID=139331 RepID=A0A557RPP9_9RHOO|nr:CBS domain-containing protein [Denitromonas ohlonensis]TVO67118.1 CBS domain-containing protein [Denitromonas ohlonensis]TVO79178.1 CBS domain-containing protein [Denitromonas ohlonensis]TVT76223.1 MAG: CBS domain-containing protein [Denitromonas halophila]
MQREHYTPLNLVPIVADSCAVEDAAYARKVTADSPAVDVMTDLRLVAAATIGPDLPLPAATQNMIQRGVRSLFVVDDTHAMLGLLCADQVLGEAPVKIATARGIPQAELTARDLMVAADRVEAVDMDDVMRSEVGHIAATLKRSGRHHLLVVQRNAAGKASVRGVFSATQIARQLGISMPSGTIAQTFADIEAALVA